MSLHSNSIAWRYHSLGAPWKPLRADVTRLRSQHPAQWSADDLSVASEGHRTTPIEESEETKLARLTAVLFLAKEPLPSRKLSKYSNLADGTEARTLVTRLNRQLDSSGRAFRVEFVAGGYQMVTRPKFAKWLRRLEYIPGEVRLSAPAMETLSVVAYQQPVVRADVEAIRGVSCGEILSQLLDRDLVRISGRSDDLGRPYLYSTTKRFLQLFGLRSLDELPRPKSFEINCSQNQNESLQLDGTSSANEQTEE